MIITTIQSARTRMLRRGICAFSSRVRDFWGMRDSADVTEQELAIKANDDARAMVEARNRTLEVRQSMYLAHLY